MKKVTNTMHRTLLFLLLTISAIDMQAQIRQQPIDREATKPTRQLYSYLRNEVWGKKVLSGCQARWDYNTTDADGIYERTGKFPAINIFDFQHFRQTNINYMGPAAKNWHDAGGIVSFIWHWSVPVSADLTSQEGFSFYSPSGSQGRPGTLFSPRRAVTHGTPEHQIINENLDTIVSYLLHYQQQGIPILWRPFHEAAGNTNRGGKAWFWWGNDGADAFKQLYLYTQRYLMEHGVHNLIYIWTSELDDDDWYPGDEYVDIVARDQYHVPSQHGSFKEQYDLLRRKYPTKMLALAECDCVPSAQAMEADDARWLFVAPWTVPFVFSQQNDNAFWQQFLSEDLILTRDETFITGKHPWQGKRVAYFGDSITDPNNDGSKKKYWGFLQDWLQIEPYVYGVSGREWNDIQRQTDQLKADHGDDVDAILIFIGTNDYNSGVPIGEWFTERSEQVMAGIHEPRHMVKRKHRYPVMSGSTYRGRINQALDYVKRAYPSKQIVLITPIHRAEFYAGEANWQPREDYTNKCGEYIDAYVQQVKEAGNIWAVPVIDLNALSGLYPLMDEHAQFFKNAENDRLHPNDEGHRRMALTIMQQMSYLPVF